MPDTPGKAALAFLKHMTPEEKRFVEAAVSRIMIRRVAEVAYGGVTPEHQITMADLPKLTK